MKPGRELDTEVALKVMGLQFVIKVYEPGSLDMRPGSVNYKFRHESQGWRTPDGELLDELPYYSTDIAAAWEVVEKLDLLSTLLLQKNSSGVWGVWNEDTGQVHFGDTAPHAICLAALKAVGVEV